MLATCCLSKRCSSAHKDKLAESFEIYSKREIATRRSSARRRYNPWIVRSASSWSEVSGGSEAISRSMASMSIATVSNFSISRVAAPCGMAKQSTTCDSGKLLLQQLLDSPHGFLPAHMLLDGKAFECLDCGLGACWVFR
jgi:hypothetical protein